MMWFQSSDVGIMMAAMSNDGLVTIDMGGCIWLWEMSLAYLDRSMQACHRMIGDLKNEPLKVGLKVGYLKMSKEAENAEIEKRNAEKM